MIPVKLTEAIKVQFLEPIFDGDFVETGMKAWLTKIEKHRSGDMYELFFDFTEFEAENDKYLTSTFYKYENGVRVGTGTAKETGWYNNKYSVYFCTSDNGANDELFSEEIAKYLKEI